MVRRSSFRRRHEFLRPSDNRSLDVAYPLTYYPDVVEADGALPIPIRGGERLPVDIHLNPVSALRLTLRVPGEGNGGFTVPQLERSAFDGATAAEIDGVRMVSPGIWELTGIPAGRYNIRTQGPGEGRTDQLDLSQKMEKVTHPRPKPSATSKCEWRCQVELSCRRNSESGCA